MKSLTPNNNLVKTTATTAGGFFVDSTLQTFVLKTHRYGKPCEIRFLGKIFTPNNNYGDWGLNVGDRRTEKSYNRKMTNTALLAKRGSSV